MARGAQQERRIVRASDPYNVNSEDPADGQDSTNGGDNNYRFLNKDIISNADPTWQRMIDPPSPKGGPLG